MSVRPLVAGLPAVLVAVLLLAGPLAGARGARSAFPAAPVPSGLSSCAAPDAPVLGAPQDCDWRPPSARAEAWVRSVPAPGAMLSSPRAVDPLAGRTPARLARWHLAHSTSTSFS